MELNTARLKLRAFQLEDFEALHQFASDFENVQHMDWGPNSEEQTLAFLRAAQENTNRAGREEFSFAIVKKDSGELLGSANIWIESSVNKRGGLGYILNRKFWRQGYGEELTRELIRFGFEDLGLHRIAATCAPNNIASKKLLEKVGMKFEGHLRENIWQRNAWRDSLLFALLRSDKVEKRA